MDNQSAISQAELQNLYGQLAAYEAQLGNERARAEVYSKECKVLQGKLRAAMKRDRQEAQKLLEKERRTAELESRRAELERQISLQEQILLEKERQVLRCERLFAQQEQLLDEKERQLQTQKHHVLKCERMAAQQAQKLEEKERKLRSQQQRLLDIERTTQEQIQQLAEETLQLREQAQRLTEENRQLQAQAQEQAQRLAEENQQLQAQAQEQAQRLTEENRQLQAQAQEQTLRLTEENRQLQAQTQRLEEESRQLAHLRSYAEGYYPKQWATFLIPQWRRYYYENYASIGEKVQALKSRLDRKSCETVDLICRRNFELLPEKEHEKKFLYRYDALYETWELEGLSHTQEKESFRRRHVIPEGCYLETTVAEFYNGLKLLPQDVQNRLQGGHIIDGGAFWGDSTLAFSEYGPAMIHCFEPDVENFACLQQTVSTNNLKNMVKLQEKGLSRTKDTAQFFSSEYESCSSLHSQHLQALNAQTAGEIELVSIDEYVRENDITVSMIKLDVEGAEYAAVEGARETICRDKPILLLSVYHRPEDFFDIKPLIESWGLGYRFMVRKTTYRDLVAEVMLIGYVEEEKEER